MTLNVACKDIMDYDRFPDYDMIWTDPPWEQKMVNFFQTIMRRDSGREASNTIHNILGKLAKLSDPDKLIVIEYSQQGHDLVIQYMELYGHSHIRTQVRPQSNGKPQVYMIFNKEFEVTLSKGMRVVSDSLRKFKEPLRVFDPFAGIGATYAEVTRAGHHYIGSEINPARFAKLVKKIEKHHGTENRDH